MKRRSGLTASIAALAVMMFCSGFQAISVPPEMTSQDGYAKIFPDYNGVTLPANLAPLNFMIEEEGDAYRVILRSKNGGDIVRENRTGRMRFPQAAWRELLAKNRGGALEIHISIKKAGVWRSFQPIVNHIAAHDIDSHLSYRLFNSVYTRWSEMGIYQRDLESFAQKAILSNQATDGNCMNCHSYKQHDPATMMMHLRGGPSSGTLIYKDGEVRKVNTETKFNKAGAYPAWHPSGKFIAFSVNKLEMFFHAAGSEPRDVLDRGSDLIVYDLEANVVTTSPAIASLQRMETFPEWSPDGTQLYFCSCPDFNAFIEDEQFKYEKIHYDLCRISFDPGARSWGEPQVVLSGEKVGKSITMPRLSPDGRYLLCCIAADGHFPIYKKSADIYLLDLASGDYQRLALNSDAGDTYPSWSSDGRWIVFSSKRIDGFTARPHFAYFDGAGTVHKPFVLPQKDPAFYKSHLKTYNRPELMTGPVPLRAQVFVKTAYDNAQRMDATLDPKVAVRDQQIGQDRMYNVERGDQ